MILFIFFFLWPVGLDPATVRNELIIWNVGQGSWATLAQNDSCDHFDVGGERAPLLAIRKMCGTRLNRLRYSHWDWDHVSFTSLLRRQSPKICLEKAPAGKTNEQRQRLLVELPKCEPTQENEIHEIHQGEPNRIASPGRIAKPISSNEASRVFITKTDVLPGDSITKAERMWANKLPPTRLRLLILGHHGSRTSTSKELLGKLPHLKQAVASARYRRYGHPHRDVLNRLRARGVAVLRTEDWGSIHFERNN